MAQSKEDPLTLRPVVRRGLLVGVLLFLLWLAWQALSGGFRQITRSRTFGQKVETVAQLECGLLSLLVMLTCFWWRRWAALVRALWSISLATAAGLSSLVWGPPMPLIGVLFVAISLFVARAVTWALHTTLSG
jgi:hypothetical protein